MITEIRNNLGFIAVAGIVLYGLHYLTKKYRGGSGLGK